MVLLWTDPISTLIHIMLGQVGNKLEGEIKMNLERITNRLAAVIARLESEGESANQQVLDAVGDCLENDISDSDRLKCYAYARISCNKRGYGEQLPPSGARDVDPSLAKSWLHITNTITSFVNDGLENNPEAIHLMRPKKNNAGLVLHTQQSLIDNLISSAQRWYSNAQKDKVWDGQMETMNTIGNPTQEDDQQNKEEAA
tara:strand:- start:113 stop:712 length:600 start_codon:yes stop_codon:yes gene_type:complete